MSENPIIEKRKAIEKEFQQMLYGMTVADQIAEYKQFYDTTIQGDDYFFKMFPEKEGKFNTACPMHSEANGESCGYTKEANLITCWGNCHKSWRVTYYHYEYRCKHEEEISMLRALRELWAMFTSNPTDKFGKYIPDYALLPYPKIVDSSVIDTNVSNISMGEEEAENELKMRVKGFQQAKEELITSTLLPDNLSLSCRVLFNFLSEKDNKKVY